VNAEQVVDTTRRWLEDVVIDLNLCPFAKRELVRERVRFSVTGATSEDDLIAALHGELQFLLDHPEVETTLLIHPGVLQDFGPYNVFLAVADELLAYLELDGVVQIASFHPAYQFEGTEPDAAENYTNRSPWPMLHLLREASLDTAIERYPDVDGIPERNIDLTNRLGAGHMRALLLACAAPQPR
jgi:hypothetical protein